MAMPDICTRCYVVSFPDRFFPFLFVVVEKPQIKMEKSGLGTRLDATVNYNKRYFGRKVHTVAVCYK